MPFLYVSSSGTTISVAAGSVRRNTEEIGDKSRAFDGTWRETIRGRVHAWEMETPPLTFADASSVWSTMNASTQPQTVGGGLVSSGSSELSCYTRAVSWVPVLADNQNRVVVGFQLDQSS